MRVLMTVAAMVLGLIGLCMSVCGGGFLLGAVVNFRDPGAGSIGLIAIPFVLLGVLLVGASIRLVRRAADRDYTDANR